MDAVSGGGFSERKTEHFVLVHGAGHGAWCWFKLLCLLQNSGHRVSIVDLAGADGVRSFDDYNAPLLGLMAALPESEKVVLVGHNAGGLSVVHAMHLFGDRIKQAIFIAATMLQFGYQTEQDIKEDSALASILLRPWPTALSTARFGSAAGEGDKSVINRVPRVYIKTANDRMVKPEQQEAMISRWPPSEVMTMDTDHSPFSAPELLCNLIIKSL
ncbi:methylesterase 17-like [Oryza brachyantha]|uniref:AB hydrolase-1 domain-containing protein n=1 Tax=Oryza brachyantha TaxID=4533 RepID=J3NAU9_ORYBR|nr:methylesterase 17-like [Oryza brachyantha]